MSCENRTSALSKDWLPPYWFTLSITIGLLLMMFADTISYGFVSDDLNLFSSTSFHDAFSVVLRDSQHFRFMWPMPYWLSYKLFGFGPKPLHISCLILHILNSVLVWRLITNLGFNSHSAAIGSLAWAVMPGNAVSVAWIVNHVDLLCTFFTLVSLLLANSALSCGTSWSRLARECLSMVSFVCAVLSKENALPLPVVVFGINLLRGRSHLASATTAMAYFGVVMAYLTIVLQNGVNYLKFATDARKTVIPLDSVLGNAIGKCVHFIEGIILQLFPMPAFDRVSIVSVFVICVALIVTYILGTKNYRRGESRIFLVCWLVMSSPAAISTDLRIFYLPSVFMILWITSIWPKLDDRYPPLRVMWCWAAIVGLLSICVIQSIKVSQRFGPLQPVSRSSLHAQVAYLNPNDLSSGAQYIRDQCKRVECRGQYKEFNLDHFWLNNYYSKKRALVRWAVDKVSTLRVGRLSAKHL